MSFESYIKNKKAIVFTLDDALFPKKDYLLQVYYLFTEFMEYSEQMDSKKMLSFMTQTYMSSGESDIFRRTAEEFNIPSRYEQNFELLHETARLPLKLLLYNKVLELLQEATKQQLTVFILADGKPEVAINKIKQIEWNGLEQNLRLYFMAEYDNSCILTLNEILATAKIKKEDVVVFVSPIQFESNFCENQIVSFSVDKILR